MRWGPGWFWDWRNSPASPLMLFSRSCPPRNLPINQPPHLLSSLPSPCPPALLFCCISSPPPGPPGSMITPPITAPTLPLPPAAFVWYSTQSSVSMFLLSGEFSSAASRPLYYYVNPVSHMEPSSCQAQFRLTIILMDIQIQLPRNFL